MLFKGVKMSSSLGYTQSFDYDTVISVPRVNAVVRKLIKNLQNLNTTINGTQRFANDYTNSHSDRQEALVEIDKYQDQIEKIQNTVKRLTARFAKTK